MEIGFGPGRDPRRPTDHGVGAVRAGDRHDDPLARLPQRIGMPLTEVGEELLFGLVGDEPQRELAQRHQVLGAEEMGQGVGHLLRRVDVAVDHAPAQRLGRGVDQLQLVGSAHDPVGHPLADPGAGHALDRIGDALEVLHVHRGDDRDPGVDELHDVLPPLLVAPRPGDVRVGELVDERQLGSPGQHGVDVHLLELRIRGRSTTLRGTTSRSRISSAVRGRPWVSTNPTTTSAPRRWRRQPSSSMAKVFPTPATAPM